MPENNRIRVMVVDDHPLVRDGIQEALGLSNEFDVVGSAADGAVAVRIAPCLRPDVVVMDVMMPGMDGVDACREIIESLPDTRVLMLTASTEETAVVEAMAAGATGFLLKDTGRSELLDAVRDVAAGRLNVPLESFRRAMETIRLNSDSASARHVSLLTPRERHIIRLFARGQSYPQIAEEQGNSPPTVRNTIYRIQDKLGVNSKQELIVWAVRSGLLDDTT